MWNDSITKFNNKLTKGARVSISDAQIRSFRGALQLALNGASKLTVLGHTTIVADGNKTNNISSGSGSSSNASRFNSSNSNNNVKFITLAELEDTAVGSANNVMGVVTRVDEFVEFKTKAGKTCSKQIVNLTDEDDVHVAITIMFRRTALPATFGEGSIMVCRDLQTGEFRGERSYTMLRFDTATSIRDHETHARYRAIREWAAASKQRLLVQAKRVTIRGLDAAMDGGSGGGYDDPDDDGSSGNRHNNNDNKRVYVVACITNIRADAKTPPWYLGCGSCKRKAQPSSAQDGAYECSACGTTFKQATPWYMLRFALTDQTGSRMVTAFQTEAQAILGVTSEELYKAYSTNMARYLSILARAANRQMVCALERRPARTDGQKYDLQMTGITELNYALETARALALLRQS